MATFSGSPTRTATVPGAGADEQGMIPQTRMHLSKLWPLTPPILFVALAAVGPMLVLTGWSLDSAALRGLGDTQTAVNPSTALIFLMMAIGTLLVQLGERVAARFLFALPIIYIVLACFEHATGIDLGAGRLLFAEQFNRVTVNAGGRIPLGPLSVLTLLQVALLLWSSTSRAWRYWAAPVATVAIAATLLLLAFILATRIEVSQRFVGAAAGSALPLCLLAGAVILGSGDGHRTKRFIDSPWYTLQRLQPIIILATVAPSIALLGARERELVSDGELFYIIAIANLFVVSILLAYVTHRANVQNRMLAGRDAKLNSILATAPDALIVTGDDFVIRTWSASTPQMWRCDGAELAGRSLHSLFEAPIDTFDDLVRTPSGTRGGTSVTTGKRCDGTAFPAEVRLGIAEQEGERVCVAFVRDLSERMAMEDQLNGLSFQLMHLSRQNAMGELAGDIAHEINQPLTAATNYASTAAYVLEQRGDSETARDYLQKITAQLLRAGGIISRLRAFLANREIELRREPLEAVVQDAVNLVRIGSRRVSGRLKVDIPSNLPPVYVDRIQIQQVLVNLLRNSFEACDETGRGPQIEIVARRAGEHLVEIEVSDNGAGLPEGFAERMGQRFSSTKGESGLGIGLNISKRIVEAHGGTLGAESRQPHGAVFRFTIPALGEMPQL